MHELAVTAIGVDQPGIVAAVARVLRDRGGNVEDSAMTILGGHFAIMLIVATDEAPDTLSDALDAATEGFGLVITVTAVETSPAASEPTHLLSVYGSDKPGILAAVAQALADLSVNITDLSTRVLAPEDQPIYAMVLELAVPPDVDEERLDAALAGAAASVGVDHTLRLLEPETY